jgi:hypothetical protein
MEQTEPSGRPLLNAVGNQISEESRRTIQSEPLLARDVTSNTEQKNENTGKTKSKKSTGKPEKRLPTVLARIRFGWKRCSEAVGRTWSKSWTTETFSLIVSVLTLAGLVTTLLAHQNKPLPQWPQLVNINSIMSLFSLLMRTCAGVILTEGTFQGCNYKVMEHTS